jgi:hypothetical protein
MPIVNLRYRPYDEVATVPNVVVDGTPTPGTTLTLSHWPGTPPLPTALQADLSAQMAFAYLDHPDALHGEAAVVSNNHLDQDGVVSAYALVDPDGASARRDVLLDLAAAGDFATYRSPTAARASMVIAAFADAHRSPLAPLPHGFAERTALLYDDLLGRLPELVDHIGRYEALWADEDADLRASEDAVSSGAVRVEEHPDVDLAVVTAPTDARWSAHRFGGRRTTGPHPMALHRATSCTTILLVEGDHFRLTQRYETWVQYRSRRLRPRVALSPLAERLGALDDVAWSADPVDELTPELRCDGGSSLPPGVVVDAVVHHLRTAPPAFDPFAGEHA